VHLAHKIREIPVRDGSGTTGTGGERQVDGGGGIGSPLHRARFVADPAPGPWRERRGVHRVAEKPRGGAASGRDSAERAVTCLRGGAHLLDSCFELPTEASSQTVER
jgi:hypothetical protein